MPMPTEETQIINAQTSSNIDQSASNGYPTESALSLYGSFDIYDIESGNIFRNDIYMNNYKGCVLGGGNDRYFIQIGGYNLDTNYATAYMHIFDRESMSWYQSRQFPYMNKARYLHSCTMVNDTIYVFGGIAKVEDIYDPMTYYKSVEYLNFNPNEYENMSMEQLLCLGIYDKDYCYIGGVKDKMYEPMWKMTYTEIRFPRVSAKILVPSQYKMFLIGGYGYDDKTKRNGAMQSIEIYDMKKNEILCNDMGPRLIIPRAAFSAGIYEDEYGYTCLHFVGGRTGIGSNFSELPLVRSCEKMCFPTKIMDVYMDNMYDLFYVEKNTVNGAVDGDGGEYNKWIIIGAIIIVFVIICCIMVIIRTRKYSKDQQYGVSENTPLLVQVNDA